MLASSINGCGTKEKVNISDETIFKGTSEKTEIDRSSDKKNEILGNKNSESDNDKNLLNVINKDIEKTKGLSEEQLNSISMLNYLTVLTKEISSSKNSRLYLEEAYSSLINNTYPNAVDSRTLIELTSLLDILENYRMLTVKRERLDYIYEQNCAQALKEAIPNPIGLLSAVNSFSLAKIATSVVYMAVDSYTSYTAYTEETDLEHLQDGWVLNDEESKNLHESRKATFEYMVEMVNNYNLPGELSLNEKAVDEFVKWKNETNIVQRIQLLESNEQTYQAFGEYWLALADSYYQNKDYRKCLAAIENYENLDIHIFRKDYNLAKILPLVIVSSSEVLDKEEFIVTAVKYLEKLENNSDKNDWKLQYFAAQTYLDLYAKTKEISYMEKAYSLALSNVTYLVDEQKNMNAKFLAEIEKAEAEDGATKEEKKEIKEYNKMLKEERKTELPPVYEPLELNCEMLFSLAEELDISDSEKEKIEGILHENDEKIFLVEPIDRKYRFTEKTDNENAERIVFNGTELEIPVEFVSDNTVISVTLEDVGKKTVFEDWVIDKVSREKKDDINSFMATYTSAGADKYKYQEGTNVRISIIPKKGLETETCELKYKTVAGKQFFVIPDIEFEKVEA